MNVYNVYTEKLVYSVLADYFYILDDKYIMFVIKKGDTEQTENVGFITIKDTLMIINKKFDA